MSESFILCEGYHDRAFWKGWLLHFGCSDPGLPTVPGAPRITVRDPWKDPVRGGQYAYHSKSGRFIRVVPSHGKGNILPAAKARLIERIRKPLLHLVINIDSDLGVGQTSSTALGLRRKDVLHFVQTNFDSMAALNAAGDVELDSGATKVALLRWEANDPVAAGLPNQQTLERLVCCALVAAYPARAKAVQDWLDTRPLPPAAGPKDHAWSYMAGWYAEHGCDDFYANLWKDPPIVAELEARLRAAGAWQVVEAVTS